MWEDQQIYDYTTDENKVMRSKESIYFLWKMYKEQVYNCLLKNGSFLIKTASESITSYIYCIRYIYFPICCCFVVFCIIFRQFTISFKNEFLGIFSCKQKGARVFQWEKDINVIVIITLSSTKPFLSFLKFESW